MAVKKIEMRPKGTGDYADVLYPKTSTDMVIDEASGMTVAVHIADTVSHSTQAEKNSWNAKETTLGSQVKVDTARKDLEIMFWMGAI
jgi:hypothetical protein